MRNDSLTASVNYGDYDGTVEADHHDHHDLFALAKKHGIDIERYFVLGVDFHIGETHGDKLAQPFVSLLAVDAQAVKAYGVDAIQRSIDERGGVLPYVKIRY